MRHAIVLTTINAKWTHPSLALRLLKANLGQLEDKCEIIEFTLRQPLEEKANAILAAQPDIVGLSVSIWNHTATIELIELLEKEWKSRECAAGAVTGGKSTRPVIVLGGTEISWLPQNADIFRYADFIVRGEGENAFRQICEQVLGEKELCANNNQKPQQNDHTVYQVDVNTIKTAYHLYTEDDLNRKLVYVESSRGCAFNCEFCLSSIKPEYNEPENAGTQDTAAQRRMRFFPLPQFLAEMDELVKRGAKTFKFLDRTFNLDMERAKQILEFFLDKIDERKNGSQIPLVVHFEMIPSRFPPELLCLLSRFPQGTLRLEIGIQTLNAEVSDRIKRPSDPQKELETLRLLRENTQAIIHADLIAGLPGENFDSFAQGFDRLWDALSPQTSPAMRETIVSQPQVEIQLGILKLLPGAPIARHTENFGMRYNPLPPYEIMETTALAQGDLERIKNFARFWELLVNRGLVQPQADLLCDKKSIFTAFMELSDSLYAHFGRNWGIDKSELIAAYGNAISVR